MSVPYVFDEFFESGLEESKSPFLEPRSKRWGKNLQLKASIVAAGLLAAAFGFFFTHETVSHLLLVLVFFLAGTESLIGAIEDLLRFEVNIDVLMTLAAFLSIFIGSGLEGGLLLVLFSLSGAIEENVTGKARSALSGLRELAPPQANALLPDGSTIERSVKDIVVGDVILVKAGDVVPLDGEILTGFTSVNLIHLTGENLPVAKQKGDNVPAGARNLEGTITLRVSHSSTESTLARLIKLITEAQETKPRLQWWIDRLSRTYATTIISLFILFSITIPLFTHLPYLGVEGSIYRALAFLIAASPCALIIAIPIGYLSAISVCARKGILLKGGIVLDALASCKAIAFDKTGTITKAELRIVSSEIRDDILAAAYAIEQGSTHPIAQAICRLAKERGLKPAALLTSRAVPGKGVEGEVSTGKIYVGKADSPGRKDQIHAVAILNDEKMDLYFEDTPREGMAALMTRLKERFSLRLLMLTGDYPESANRIAKLVGVEEVFAKLLPEEKLKMVADLSETDHLAMIGDGINDAPALTRATVGISMGKVGSTSAVDASDIVLLHDDLNLLDWLIAKARKTRSIIAMNVIFAMTVILVASMLALFGIVPLWLAVVLHEGGTVLVGLNSLRLLRS